MSLAIQITSHAPEEDLAELEAAVTKAVKAFHAADDAAGRPRTTARIFGNDYANSKPGQVKVVERVIVSNKE